MRKWPRKRREIIGILVTLAGLAIQWWLMDGDEALMLLGSIPFVAFFMWVGREVVQTAATKNHLTFAPSCPILFIGGSLKATIFFQDENETAGGASPAVSPVKDDDWSIYPKDSKLPSWKKQTI